MRIGMLLNDNPFGLQKNEGELIEVYSMEDIINFPNVSKDEINECLEELEFWKDSKITRIVGFAKSDVFTDEEPIFIQIFNDEVKFVQL